MDRAQKKAVVTSLKESLSSVNAIVIAHYKGLTVEEMSDLRVKARKEGVNIRVTKNRLTKISLKDTKFSNLVDFFKGPTAISYSNDPVATAKVFVNYAKNNEKLTIVAGAMDSQVLKPEEVKALADLPSLDTLRANIIGLLQAPASRIATVLQAPGSGVARVISAHATKSS